MATWYEAAAAERRIREVVECQMNIVSLAEEAVAESKRGSHEKARQRMLRARRLAAQANGLLNRAMWQGESVTPRPLAAA